MLFYLTIILPAMVMCFASMTGTETFNLTNFTKDTICNLPGRLVKKCVKQQAGLYRSLTDCAYECAQDGSCIGASVGKDQTCYHHLSCDVNFSCGVGTDLSMYRKVTTFVVAQPSKPSAVKTTSSVAITTSRTTTATTATEVKLVTSVGAGKILATTEDNTKLPTTKDRPTLETTEDTTKLYITTGRTTLPTTEQTQTTTARTTKQCQNNGTWDYTAWKCSCIGGYVGDSCERRAKDCRDLLDYGYPKGWPAHWIYIQVDGFPEPIFVRCHLTNTYFTMYIMINKGYKNNTMPWYDYEKGYFLEQYHYWLGLEKMKKFNDLGYKTVYLDTSFNAPNGENNLLQYRYDNFKLETSSKGYSFNFTSSTLTKNGNYCQSLTYTSCLDNLKGAQFSTWDKGYFKYSAVLSGVGWWYNDYYMVCNPLGWTYENKPSSTETPKHIKMAGLNYRTGEYAHNIATTMYFQVNLI